jgi:uncharacterized membrane-anchored protein
MADLLTMILLDCSMVTSMLILAYLSKRLGNALKIRPYYALLYCTSVLIAVATGFDIAAMSFSVQHWPQFTLYIRGIAGCIAFGACLPYWKWLFSEFFGA